MGKEKNYYRRSRRRKEDGIKNYFVIIKNNSYLEAMKILIECIYQERMEKRRAASSLPLIIGHDIMF